MTVNTVEPSSWWHRRPPYVCRCGALFDRTDHLDLTELDGLTEEETQLCELCFEELMAEHACDEAIGRAELVQLTPDWPGSRSGTVTYFAEDGARTEHVVVTPWEEGERREQPE